MNAPPARLSPVDFEAVIQKHISDNYQKGDGGGYNCHHCGSKIQQITGSASIHEAVFGDPCAGFGEVYRFPLPFCPKCEGKPTQTGTCIHVHVL